MPAQTFLTPFTQMWKAAAQSLVHIETLILNGRLVRSGMFLHSWSSYFRITLCTLLPLIGTLIKNSGVTPSDAFASDLSDACTNTGASRGKLMNPGTDKPHSFSQLQGSPSHQACQILMEQVKSLRSVATFRPASLHRPWRFNIAMGITKLKGRLLHLTHPAALEYTDPGISSPDTSFPARVAHALQHCLHSMITHTHLHPLDPLPSFGSPPVI